MAKHEKGVVSTNDNEVYVTHVENYLVSFSLLEILIGMHWL